MRNGLVAALICAAGAANAQSVESFYRGRQIEFIVGSEGGSSYDGFARLLARYMPEHIPGNPSFVVRLMPGAGHIKATNYLYSVAPRDGTSIGIISQLIPTAAALKNKPGLEADFRRMNWIGSTDTANQVCIARPDARVKKGADLFTQTLIVGGAGAGSGVSTIPIYLREIYGMKFELIEGYKNSGDVMLAMDRGEVEGVCQTYQGFDHSRPGWITQGKANLLFNLEKEPIPGLGAPSIRQFIKTPQQMHVADFFSDNNNLGRPVVGPPDIPAERLDVLRRAFDAAVRDPGYLADAKRQNLDPSPKIGEEQEKLFREILETPEEIIRLAAKFLG